MKRKYLRWIKASVSISVIYAFLFQQTAFCLEQIAVGYGKEYENIQEAVAEHPFPDPLTDNLEFLVDIGPDGYTFPHEISIEDFGETNGKSIEFVGVATQPIVGKRKDFLVAMGGAQLGVLEATGEISHLGSVSELTHAPGVKEVFTANGNYDYTVALLTDQVGNVVRQVQLNSATPDQASYHMYAYGQPIPGEDGLQKSGDKSQGVAGFAFTGKPLDNTLRSEAESDRAGLYYFGARLFDPEIGIWLTPDPSNTFLNAYAYGNDPVNTVDQDGKEPITIGAILIGALIIGAIIGGAIGAYQGYKMAEASGASGWGYVGYIAAGTAIGAVSGGVAGVTAAGAGILTALGCVPCAPVSAYLVGAATGSFTSSVLNKAAYGTELSVSIGPYSKNLEGGEDGGFPEYTDWDSPTGFIDNTLTTLAYAGPVLAVAGAVSPQLNPFARAPEPTPTVGEGIKTVPDENAPPKLDLNVKKEITPSKTDRSQMLKNAVNGKRAELKFKARVEKSGKFEIVGEKIYVKTQATNRIVDFIVRDKATGQTVLYEIKTGGATRGFSQLLKDNLIETKGGIAHGVAAQKFGLEGSIIRLPTRELNVRLP